MVFTHKYGAFLSSNPVIMEVHPTKYLGSDPAPQHPEHGRESQHNHAALLQDIQKQSGRQSVLPATVLGQVSNEYGNFAAVTHKNSRNPCWKRVWLGLHQLACSSCFANFLCSCCTRVCLGACIAFQRWGTKGDSCHFNKYSLDPWNPKDLNHACQLPTESWSNLRKIADDSFLVLAFSCQPAGFDQVLVQTSLFNESQIWSNTLFSELESQIDSF